MDAAALEYFHIVSKAGSISKAAGELEMEPSTLTRHIGRLEQELGVRLFHRSGRGMLLTDAGGRLLHEATKVIETLQQTRRVAADLARHGPARIVIAGQPTIANVAFADIARKLRDRFPLARIQFVEGFGCELIDWLREGRVDFGLLYVPGQTQLVQYELLLQEPLYCIVPADCAANESTMQSAQVIELPLLLPSTLHGLRSIAERWAHRHGRRLNVVMECDGSVAMIRRMVESGLGCTILPLAAVHEAVSSGRIRAVRIEGHDCLRPVALAMAQNRPPLTQRQEASEVLRSVIRSLVESARWPGVSRMAT